MFSSSTDVLKTLLHHGKSSQISGSSRDGDRTNAKCGMQTRRSRVVELTWACRAIVILLQLTLVADCYAFKSRLQEYAQKVNIPTPVYETEKEGLSHEPVFRSSVIVNGVRYESLPGFYNRKAAEQSAAEVALFEIQKSGHNAELIPTLHETGLCKNLLQEYAQKMNYAIPSYMCSRHTSENSLFTCSVEIGGIRYIGAAARTKKEAEIKAARTALLAIQSSSSGNETNVISQFTVLPGKKKGKEMEIRTGSTKEMKPKKSCFKKKSYRKKLGGNKKGRSVYKHHPAEILYGETDPVVTSAEAGRMETDVLMPCSENENSVINLIESYGDLVLNDCENTLGCSGLSTRRSSLDRSNLIDENIVEVDLSEKTTSLACNSDFTVHPYQDEESWPHSNP